MRGERRNERVIWNESELSLVSGVGLNGKKDDKGDMEKERDGWRGAGERFVCFFTTLCGLVISWEEVREMVGLFFSFCSFLGFCFSLWFLQTNCSISPCLPLPPIFYLFSFYLSLVSALRWKFEIILTRPFCLDGKETAEPTAL